jgi:2'-5' RNA ligase
MPVRAFVAIEVPVAELKGIDEVLNALGSITGLKCVERQNIHITVRFLGDVSEPLLASIESAIADALQGANEFSIQVSGLGAFPSDRDIRVVWAKAVSQELEGIALKINSSIDKLGIKADKPFTPHITLARLKMRQFERTCKDVIAKYRTMEFGAYRTSKVKLKKSTLTPSGPIYEDIEVWTLPSPSTGAPSEQRTG